MKRKVLKNWVESLLIVTAGALLLTAMVLLSFDDLTVYGYKVATGMLMGTIFELLILTL